MAGELEILKKSYIYLYKRLEGNLSYYDKIKDYEGIIAQQSILLGKYVAQIAELKTGVLKDHVLVPIKATEKMIDTYFNTSTAGLTPEESVAVEWAAMVKAAQEGEE